MKVIQLLESIFDGTKELLKRSHEAANIHTRRMDFINNVSLDERNYENWINMQVRESKELLQGIDSAKELEMLFQK
jgi:putative SOS response-associated peptidase YedK